jgi:hypothetical protein
MGLIDCLEEHEIEPFEYGHLVEDTWHGADSFKLYIPKLYVQHGRGKPLQNRYVFNNNIFLNDAACKPTAGKNITRQNYITVKRHLNRNFAVRADNRGILKAGQKFIIHVMDRNIRDMRITDII